MFARRKIACYLMCCGEACHTSYARVGLFMLAEKISPTKSSDCEEVLF